MKKTFKLYIATWGLLLALFNLITFIVPSAPDAEKYTNSFWIGYAFITVALIGQFVCSTIVFKRDEYRIAFYDITLLQCSFIGLVASFVVGIVCMVIPSFPYWVATILCAIVLVLNAFAVIRSNIAVGAVESIDEKIKEKTFFIKSLTIDAETLEASAKSEAAKAECRKVAEALKYSDPMSSDALASVEGQIASKFTELSDAVKADDAEKIAELSKEVVILVGDRNKKCKLLK